MKNIDNINDFLTGNIVAKTNNIDTKTPITEEIILEMSKVLQKESMRKLVIEVLEVIEKHNIEELLVYNSGMIEKGKMILHY